jgi:hypothetical protein
MARSPLGTYFQDLLRAIQYKDEFVEDVASEDDFAALGVSDDFNCHDFRLTDANI